MPDERELQELGKELYKAQRELAEAQRRVDNAVRNRGQLATETLENVSSQRAALQMLIDKVNDIASNATGSDVRARLQAIKRVTDEAKKSGRR